MSRSKSRESDTSRYSYYITDAFYADLIDQFTDWTLEETLAQDTSLRENCQALLYREARLLDQARFDEWLSLYSKRCIYWVPGSPGGGDPRKEVAICFDDRRRLEDRIYRIRTGYAWSQVPSSRTTRSISNIEVFEDPKASVMVRSNFSIHEFRAGQTRILSGWYAHKLGKCGGDWRILVKQVNLIDCDQNLPNPSLVF